MKKSLLAFILAGFAFSTYAANEQDAYQVARTVIPEGHQKKVLSFYGKGTIDDVSTWYVKFYDPGAKSNARIVVVQDGKVDHFNAAEDQEDNDARLAFDPSQYRVGVRAALKTAAKYAKDSVIPVDATRVYLNRPAVGKAPVWTVELYSEGKSQGYIYANDRDGSYAGYRPPGAAHRASHGDSGATAKRSGSGSGSGKGFGEEVKDTFLGVGGDLEEFFTGERTVDK